MCACPERAPVELTYEVHLEKEHGDIEGVTVYALDEGRQMRVVNARLFGPFATPLDVSQWVWRTLTLDLASPLR